MPTFEFTAPDKKKYRVTGPEGATAEQAFQMLPESARAPATQPGQIPTGGGPAPDKRPLVSEGGLLGSAAEAALHMGTGAIAKPVSEVMGMAATAYDAATGRSNGVNATPQGFQQDIQRALTYEPRSRAGSAIAEYNPMALAGRGINWLGGQAEQIVAPPETGEGRQAFGRAVHEGINQAAGILPLKYWPQAADAAAGSLRRGAERQMASALKPTVQAWRTGKAGKAIDTMLEEGLNVSPGGVEKMQSRIAALNDRVADAIKNSNAMVDVREAAKAMRPVVAKFTKQVNATDDLASLQRAYDDFIQHPLIGGRTQISVQVAQELKSGTYRTLGDRSYGELKGAQIEAQKALARGLKEEIDRVIPGVRALNAEESRLLNALSVSERRVMMEANKNPIGLGLLTTNPIHFAAWVADRSGLFKSLIARMLNQGSKAVQATAPLAPLGAVGMTPGAIAPPPQQQQP